GARCSSILALDESLGQLRVGIDAPVTEERPADAERLHVLEVDALDEHALLVRRRPHEDAAVRRGKKALAPELDAPAPLRRRLEADAVHGQHEAAVRDRVGTL